MTKVLITGVAGFIGSNLLDVIIEETDWDIVGIDNCSTGSIQNINHRFGNSRFEYVEDDLKNLESIAEYTTIFHLAALPRIQPSFDLIGEHVEANLGLGIHLIELMIKENRYPKLVYSGSSAIYGTPLNTPTDENERIDCLSPYAFQKYEFERYLEIISTRYPLDYITLRYFNPYGPRSFNAQNPFNAYSSVVGIFLNKYQNGEELLVTGDGKQKRDFIHVADVARANVCAAKTEKGLNKAFNIGAGETMSVLELAQLISNNYRFIDKREGESMITHANIDSAKKFLGWTPKEDLRSYIENEIS